MLVQQEDMEMNLVTLLPNAKICAWKVIIAHLHHLIQQQNHVEALMSIVPEVQKFRLLSQQGITVSVE